MLVGLHVDAEVALGGGGVVAGLAAVGLAWHLVSSLPRRGKLGVRADTTVAAVTVALKGCFSRMCTSRGLLVLVVPVALPEHLKRLGSCVSAAETCGLDRLRPWRLMGPGCSRRLKAIGLGRVARVFRGDPRRQESAPSLEAGPGFGLSGWQSPPSSSCPSGASLALPYSVGESLAWVGLGSQVAGVVWGGRVG